MYGVDEESEMKIRKFFAGELSTREIDKLIKEVQVFYLLNDVDRKLTGDEIKFIEDFI